jgi:hypothetical protein
MLKGVAGIRSSKEHSWRRFRILRGSMHIIQYLPTRLKWAGWRRNWRKGVITRILGCRSWSRWWLDRKCSYFCKSSVALEYQYSISVTYGKWKLLPCITENSFAGPSWPWIEHFHMVIDWLPPRFNHFSEYYQPRDKHTNAIRVGLWTEIRDQLICIQGRSQT